MSLSQITIPSKTIPAGEGQSFEVYAVSMEVIAMLSESYLDELKSLFVTSINNQNADVKKMGAEFISKFPGFVSALIASSCGEPDQASHVSRFPLPIQLEAFTSIVDLTVSSSGGLKKCLQQIMEAMQLTTNMIHEMSDQAES